MKTDLPRGRDFITIATFSREEIEPIIDPAPDCKRQFGLQESHRLLEEMTPPMMLYAISRAPGTASKPR